MKLTDTILGSLVGLVVISAILWILLLRTGKRSTVRGKNLQISQVNWLRLEALAQEQSGPDDLKTVDDLVDEGINLVLQKYSNPPVA